MNAASVYLVIRGLFALADSIMFTTYALYYVQGLGLNPFQLVLVGTAVELAVVLFEIPTGVVADSYSRRLSVIIGTFVMGGAYLLEGAIPYFGGLLPFFGLVLAAEAVRGFGWTFLSGAQEAWVTDEVGADKVGPLFLRAGKISRLMGLVGIPVSVLLANIALNLPFLVGGLLVGAVGIFILLRMEERHFVPRPREDRTSWRMLQHTFKDGLRAVRGRPVLLALLAVSLVGGAASEGLARLWGAHLLTTFGLEGVSSLTPAAWFGLIAAASSLVGMLAAGLGERYLDLTRPRRVLSTLFAASGLQSGAVLLLALAPNLGWALAAMLLLGAIGAVHRPVWETWVNQQVESRVRATVLSLIGQADALGQSGGGPVVGWVGSRYTIRTALGLAAVLMAPALAVYSWLLRRGGEPAGADEQAG